MPVLVPNERGLDRALDKGCATSRSSRVGDRDVRAAQPQPQPRRAVRDVRAGRGAGARRRDARPRLRVHVLRRPVGGRCRCRPGGRPSVAGCSTSAATSSPSATPSASPRRATSRRCSAASSEAGLQLDQLGDALPRHLRAGAVQRADRDAARRHDLRRVRGRTRRLSRTPRAPPATSRPRTSSGSWPGSASRPASTSRRWSRPSVWMAEQIGKPPLARRHRPRLRSASAAP